MVQSLDNICGERVIASPQKFDIFANVHHRGVRVDKVHLYCFVAYGDYTRAIGHKTAVAYGCRAGIELNGVVGNGVDNFFHF